MKYTDKADTAAMIATRTMAFARKHRLPLNPQNFAILYEHAAQRNPDLSRRIEEAVSSGEALAPEVTAKIYADFFEAGAQPPKQNGLNKKFESVLEFILEAVAGAGKDTTAYTTALEDFSGNMASAENIEDARPLIAGILSQTQTMNTQINLLQQRADQAAQEINALKQNLKEARRDADFDGLTGIANRKSFDKQLKQAMQSAGKEDTPLCLVLCDLDHFKSFNDTHGHQVGDQILKLVAQTLVRSVKGQDTAARYGGEEFAIILPGTSAPDSLILAENIRVAIATKKLVIKDSGKEMGNITLSMGLAGYIRGETAETLIERADRALYQAKGQGRNRVVSAELNARLAAE